MERTWEQPIRTDTQFTNSDRYLFTCVSMRNTMNVFLPSDGLIVLDGWMAMKAPFQVVTNGHSGIEPDPQMCSQDAKPTRHKDTLGSQCIPKENTQTRRESRWKPSSLDQQESANNLTGSANSCVFFCFYAVKSQLLRSESQACSSS